MLSYEEVISLSRSSLKRTIKDPESSEIVDELAEYFARLIFRLVDISMDREIELMKIKEVMFLILPKTSS